MRIGTFHLLNPKTYIAFSLILHFLMQSARVMESQSPNSRKNLEQREVEKYIKFFTLKSMQCVIDSRTGFLSSTRCNPTAKGVDWFNISIPDSDSNRKFQNTIREQFGKRVPGIVKPVCVDIVLHTSDGTSTILESWQVSTKVNTKNENIKNHFSIYNRLGVLLKSVISISRVLPSYQLCRKSDCDFMLFFKVHSELYPLHHYELHNIITIGSVITPIGEISIKTLYRNKVWLTSGSIHSLTYFIHDNTSSLFPLSIDRDKTFHPRNVNAKNEIALAVSDLSPCLPDWFSASSSHSSDVSSAFKNTEKLSYLPDKQVIQSNQLLEKTVERPVAAFAEPYTIDLFNMPNLDLPELTATPPFLSLLQDSPNSKIKPRFTGDDESTDTVTSGSVTHEPGNDRNKSLGHRRAETVGYEDDFVLVELRPAFCSDLDSVGSLFRQCQSPVALDMFDALEKEDREGEAFDLDTQLEKYRKELQEFENFFKDMF